MDSLMVGLAAAMEVDMVAVVAVSITRTLSEDVPPALDLGLAAVVALITTMTVAELGDITRVVLLACHLSSMDSLIYIPSSNDSAPN